ncbi:hypothetical protein M4D68_00740 [Priestia aryabhattai]|uniref:hypothetical protein n=1 Tax=Priestia aryabhattai TaxID=412384 RepID=UPI00204046DB|nr:hypothetical protein [Priestia aryabhattai]MCM3639673.1 hypothetical protein [Priestia aryabhattai]
MKQIEQSQKLVSKAVGVFDKAVTDVEKANEILKKGIEEDSMRILALQDQIKELEADKEAKGAELTKNEHLLATLKQFTKQA